jgi:integrase
MFKYLTYYLKVTTKMQQTLLYQDIERIPEKFFSEDIEVMLNTLDNSNDYLKTVWGEWMKARDKAILMTVYLLGLRPLETCALRFDDFNMRDETVLIRGENNKQKKDRILPIPKKLLKYVMAYLKFPRFMWKSSSYIFPSAENEHISSERWKHIFREKILKPSGLWVAPVGKRMPKYRSYTLRSTRATELLDKTKDPFLVARFLGHSDLRSIKKYIAISKTYKNYMGESLNSLDN